MTIQEQIKKSNGYTDRELSCKGCNGPCGQCPPPSIFAVTADNREQSDALIYAKGLLAGYLKGLARCGQRIAKESIPGLTLSDSETVNHLRDIIGLPRQQEGEARFADVVFYDGNYLPF